MAGEPDESAYYATQTKEVLLRLLHEQMDTTEQWKQRFRGSEAARLTLLRQLDEQKAKPHGEPPDLRRYALTQRPIYCLSCVHSREPGCICPKYQVGPTQVGG